MPTPPVASDLSTADALHLSRLWPSGKHSAGQRDSVWEPNELAEVLRLQLASPVDPPVPISDLEQFGGTFGELLMNAAPPAALLVRVKDWAKPMMARQDAELPREVAGVLYFAAVAAARLRGVESVSQLPAERVQEGATWALRQPWLDASMTDLFQAFLKMCPPAPSPHDPPVH